MTFPGCQGGAAEGKERNGFVSSSAVGLVGEPRKHGDCGVKPWRFSLGAAYVKPRQPRTLAPQPWLGISHMPRSPGDIRDSLMQTTRRSDHDFRKFALARQQQSGHAVIHLIALQVSII